MSKAQDAILAHAREHAKKDFADHVLTQEGEGRWLCARPGTGINSFRVVASRRCVLVHGDVGELVLCPSDDDALAWLRSTLRAPVPAGLHTYALGKIPEGFRRHEFNREHALELVDEVEKDGAAGALDLQELREQVERLDEGREENGSAAEFAGLLAGLDGGPEMCDLEPSSLVVWPFRTLYLIEALSWFVQAIDEAESRPSWLLLCTKESGHGDVGLWWRPNGAGYTRHVEEAGRYTQSEAGRHASPADGVFCVLEADALAARRSVVPLDAIPGAWQAIRAYRSATR